MAGIGRKLGAAFVELFVKKDRLDADLNAAKASVAQATGEMADGGNVAAEAIAQTGTETEAAATKTLTLAQKLREATAGARALRAAILGIVGIIGSIVAVVGLIVTGINAARDAMFGSRQEAEAFKERLEASEKRVDAINEKIREQIRLQAELRGEKAPDTAQEDDNAKEKQRLNEILAETEKLNKTIEVGQDMLSGKRRFASPSWFADYKRAIEELTKLEYERSRIIEQMRQADSTKELARIKAEEKAKIDSILAESNARREAAQDREFEEMLREGLRGLYEQTIKQQADAAAHQIQLQNEAHSMLIAQRQEQHAAMMRAVEEFKNKLQGEFTALGGIRRLEQIPAILEKIRSGL